MGVLDRYGGAGRSGRRRYKALSRGVDLNVNCSSQWRGGGRPWDTY